jgi:ribosomal protein S18 acetylase RimI-like enzyme
VLDRAATLAQYDREMRADPPASRGATFERTAALVRERGEDEDTVLYARLLPPEVEAAVRAEAARSRASGRPVEWKVYDHDGPSGLVPALEREGFVGDEPETLVVLDLEGIALSVPAPAGVLVREVRDLATFEDALQVSEAAFGPDGPRTLEHFRDRLDDPTARLFVAYLDDRPVSAGRLELPPGRSFAGLWGGGTIPDARHRGLYRALVDARARRARSAGYRYLTVDARETSRPILERVGFVPLVGVRGWVLTPAPRD